MDYLILWEDNPERIRFFWLKTDDAVEKEYAERCHGKMYGVNDSPEDLQALNWLNLKLFGERDGEKVAEPLEPCYDSKSDTPFVVAGETYFQIVHTGVML